MDTTEPVAESPRDSAAPDRAGLVLVSLILVAGVANLNLSVANVALPSIAQHFDSSQTALDLIAVGYSLGLAASVLYLGALGDRYGRKLMLVLGMVLSVPACLLAAYAPSDTVLFAARVLGGVSAGMAYPTTLALITALWSGPGRTKSIALWSAIGGGIASLGPLVAGALLEHFWWGSVFLVTLPLAVVALAMAILYVPSHVNETTEPVDNLGGILSLVLVGALILSINFASAPNAGTLTIVLAAIAAVALIGFYLRQRRAASPLYDLHVAAPSFRQHGRRGARCHRDVVHPLGALFIRSDDQRSRNVRRDPAPDVPRRVHGHRGHAVDVRETLDSMQVRVDGHQPVDVLRKNVGERMRRDRLARAKAGVLAHVREIRRDEPNPPGAEVVQRVGEKQEWKHLGIGLVERAYHDRVAPRHVGRDADVRFTVRKAAAFRLTNLSFREERNSPARLLVAGQGEEQRRRHFNAFRPDGRHRARLPDRSFGNSHRGRCGRNPAHRASRRES